VIYERVVQVQNIAAHSLPLLFDFIYANAPQGGKLTMKINEPEDENIRYIPNVELRLCEEELKSYDDPSVRRKKQWSTE